MRESALLLLLLSLSSCVTRQEVQADIWIVERVPESICNQVPELWNYGINRVVLCKNRPTSQFCQHGEPSFEEFIPYCDKAVSEYLAMHHLDTEKWLNQLTRPKSKSKANK